MSNSPDSSLRWHVRWGWIHRPVSPAGYIVALLTLAFCVHLFLAFDRRAHSVSDLFYALYPYWGCTFLGWAWVAERTAGRE